MRARKIPITIDIKTILDTGPLKRFQNIFQNMSSGDQRLFGNVNKDIRELEKHFDVLANFKLNENNVGEFTNEIIQLSQTVGKLEQDYSRLQLEATSTEERIARRTEKHNDAIREQQRLREEWISLQKQYQEASDANEDPEKIAQLEAAVKKAFAAQLNYGKTVKAAKEEVDALTAGHSDLQPALEAVARATKQGQQADENYNKRLTETKVILQDFGVQDTINQLQRFATRLLSVGTVVHLARQQLRQMIQTYKELDASLTQIAVVTGRTRDSMWGMISTYNEMAQRLGVTTADVVNSSKLYFQQGRSQSEVMKLVEQTTILASIAELDFTEATNFMTAAINGFKLSAEDAIAVTDTWANLASQAAVDVSELATAISKVASIAQSAGMDINSTSAFLTKMIETTREAPENLGTALKTVIARFQELKSVGSLEDGIDANKVETALKSAGVALRDAQGQFRDFDDVILDLSKVWDSLDRNTQRYIATIAAGSRQQSRFIALVEDYSRNLELMEIASDSAGASTAQFGTQLEGLRASFNRLQAGWESIYTSFQQGPTWLSKIIDALANLLSLLGDAGANLSTVFAGSLIITIKSLAKEFGLLKGSTGEARIRLQLVFEAFKNEAKNNSFNIFDYIKFKLSPNAKKQAISGAKEVAEGVNKTIASNASAAATSVKEIDTAFSMLGATLKSFAIAATITAIVGALIYLATWEERRSKKLQKAREEAKQQAAATQQEVRSLESLKNAYEKAYKNGEDLTDIKQQIIDQFPELKAALEDESASYADINRQLKETLLLKQQELVADQQKATQARAESEDFEIERQIKELETQRNNIESVRAGNQYDSPIYIEDEEEYLAKLKEIDQQIAKLKQTQQNFKLDSTDLSVYSDYIALQLEGNARINKQVAQNILQQFANDFKDGEVDYAPIIQAAQQISNKVSAILADTKVDSSDKDLIQSYIAQNVDHFDTADWERLFKLMGNTINRETDQLYTEWLNNSEQLFDNIQDKISELVKNGIITQDIADQFKDLSNEAKKSFIEQWNNTEDDTKAQRAIVNYYNRIFSPDFKEEIEDLIGGEDLYRKMLNLDPSEASSHLSFLADLVVANGELTEAYKLQNEQLDLNKIGIDDITIIGTNYANQVKQISKAVEEGFDTWDDAYTFARNFNIALENINWDESGEKLVLSAEAGEQAINKEREAAEKLHRAFEQALIDGAAQDLTEQIGNGFEMRADATWDDIIATYTLIDTLYDTALARLKEKKSVGEALTETGLWTDENLALIESLFGISDATETLGKSQEEIAEARASYAARLQHILDLRTAQRKELDQGTRAVNNYGSATEKAKSAVEQLTDSLKAQQDELQNQMYQYEDQITRLERLIEDQEYQIDLIERQIRLKERVLDQLERERDALKDQLDEEKDLDKLRIDAAKRRLEVMMDMVDRGLDWNDPEFTNRTIDELKKMADASEQARAELEALMAVEKARDAYENAKKQKVQRVYYADKGWVWEADQKAVKEAEDSLNEALSNLDDLWKESEKKKLQDLIDGYDKVIEDIDLTLEEKQLLEQIDAEYASKTYEEMLDDLANYVDNRVPYYQEMNQQVADYDKQIEELGLTIEELKLQVEDLKYQNDLWKDQITDLEERMKPLKRAYEDLGEEISRLGNSYYAAAKGLQQMRDAQNAYNTAVRNRPITTSQPFAERPSGHDVNIKVRGGVGERATGGPVNSTDIYKLHGTKSRPELVLNNSQTAALFKFISGMADTNFASLKNDRFFNNLVPTTTNNTDNSTVFQGCAFEINSNATSIDALITDIKNKAPIHT